MKKYGLFNEKVWTFLAKSLYFLLGCNNLFIYLQRRKKRKLRDEYEEHHFY